VASQKAHPSHPKSRKRVKLPTVTTISPSDKDK
jgi:hypothetical protein